MSRTGAIGGCHHPDLRVSAFAALLFFLAPWQPAGAVEGHWQPPGIEPTTATLSEVFAKRDEAAGEPAQRYARRVERWSVRTGDDHLETVVSVAGLDLRFDTAIAGATYAEGRAGGLRWRETPNGLVRVVAADVQGDQLDRWPLGIFPYRESDCRLIGETADAPKRYVVEYRPAHDWPHWFFFDRASGALTNETVREGSRTYAFAFSDFRTVDGAVRPFAWHVGGWGDEEDVTVDSAEPSEVSDSAVALPVSRTDGLATFDTDSVRVPAGFNRGRISIDGSINGHRAHFIFDSGTTQLLLDGASARRFGIATTLGHGIAGDLTTGPVHFKNVAIQTTALANFGADGILGYEYFSGHVVHLDYLHERLSFERRDAFQAPAASHEMKLNYTEGVPLGTATIGAVTSSRIVLDTGSSYALFLRPFFVDGTVEPSGLGFQSLGALSTIHFLEGPIEVREAQLSAIAFAGVVFHDNSVQIQVQSHGDAVDFPIDGVFGTQVLDKFEWWFDYDGGRAWTHPF
jgi:hypothetical protein